MKNALIALMVAPALGLLLAPVQPVFAQGGADSLYDIAPGQTPPDRDRDLDRELAVLGEPYISFVAHHRPFYDRLAALAQTG